MAGLFLLHAEAVFGAEASGDPVQMTSLSAAGIFTLLFLMLGPIKVIRPFAMITEGADLLLAHRIAARAILFSILTLLLAALIGESVLRRYDVPVPVLALAGGIVLFLVALQTVLQQFTPPARNEAEAASGDSEYGHHARGAFNDRDAL